VTHEEVSQRHAPAHFLVPVFHTWTACCGAVTAHVLRRIAYRAGAYAPGIQEHVFHELNTARDGGTIENVQGWFASRLSLLHQLGYRLHCRRVTLLTSAILDWVQAGKGYRGAMLPTNYSRLHAVPGSGGKEVADASVAHAVGVTIDRLDAKGDEDLVMIDPWPGGMGEARDRSRVSSALEQAHRDRNFHALVYFWSGWS
jgi:hypothetical protein